MVSVYSTITPYVCVQVMLVEHDPNGGIGHAYYMDGDGQFREAPSAGLDCAFAAMSAILQGRGISKSVDELRNEAADRMESNSASFERVVSAEGWIR